MPIRTFQYRMYPTTSQERQMIVYLAATRNLYNMCLSARKLAWEHETRNVSKPELLRLVKHYKRTFLYAKVVHSHALQVAVVDLDKAFRAFYRRVKAGETPGFPRFKSDQRWHSFGFKEYGNGFKIDGRRLKVSGVGRIRVRWHRPIGGYEPCTIKICRIVRKAGKWYVAFSVDIPKPKPLPQTNRLIGLDVGISALYTTSDGTKVENPNYYREAQAALRRRQRKLARAKRGSKNRRRALLRVQCQQEHVANQRKDYLHKLSTELVHNYDLIALEDLQVRNMVRNRTLSKSILDSGWSTFRHYLTYKAESAGCEMVFVDPAYTSKSCSNCGAIFENLTLRDRWVECECGLSLDRDHNAAINILSRARSDRSVQHNVEGVDSCVL